MPTYGFLSTFPPTRCGLATFTQSLATAIVGSGLGGATIVRVMDGPVDDSEGRFGSRLPIAAHLVAGDPSSMSASIRALNACDVAIVQHEYGIFGGTDGDEVIGVLEQLTAPAIVVLHTVLEKPTPNQKRVLERVCELATSVVVMSDRARTTLEATYAVDLRRVQMIPHGVPDPMFSTAEIDGHRIVTWGLIGPGKGIEWGIRALALLGDLDPLPEYVIVGRTHPKVLAHEGEAYRDSLKEIARELGVEAMVTFVDEYLDAAALAEYVTSADVVLLPYDNRDQVTSGVLVEAVAAARPVVATAFPHAVELLTGGAGLVVDHGNPQAIAAALRTVFSGQGRLMSEVATRVSLGTSWTEIAARYDAVAATILESRAA